MTYIYICACFDVEYSIKKIVIVIPPTFRWEFLKTLPACLLQNIGILVWQVDRTSFEGVKGGYFVGITGYRHISLTGW